MLSFSHRIMIFYDLFTLTFIGLNIWLICIVINFSSIAAILKYSDNIT